jgi:GMP reductase
MENVRFKFDFDDILIVPNVNTQITSRYQDIKLPVTLPLFTAPMDTVIDLNNVHEFYFRGINVALPRTISFIDYLEHCKSKEHCYYQELFVSFGLYDITIELNNKLEKISHKQCILIDVANGHMQKIVDICQKIKELRPDIIIMVGNIANPETYLWYCENNCVDYIRVGIGNGNGCLTTKQSGIGHPMASLIYEIRQLKIKYETETSLNRKAPYIVADGGMKDYSDIIKSLALGADYVMIGSIFNKAIESAAANYLYGIKLNKKLAYYLFSKGYSIKKYFRGMSTKEAQKAMGKTQFKTSEGVVRFRKIEYDLSGWIENFEHYLRNAMSYTNAKTLEDFIGNVNICQISKNAYDRFNK